MFQFLKVNEKKLKCILPYPEQTRTHPHIYEPTEHNLIWHKANSAYAPG